jgi:ribosomal protein S18 acetylase RimI-like enzyme
MLECACADAWPPLVREQLGEWRLRWADGFTGRANSALAVGDPGVGFPEALRTVREFAHSHGITPAVQVVQGSPAEAAIEGTGWVTHDDHPGGHEVAVLIRPLESETPGTPEVSVAAAPNAGWWELTAGTTEPTIAQRHVLTSGNVGYGVAEADGMTAGAVRPAIVGDLLHVSRLAVRPAFRRRGLAGALMAVAATWAADLGATRAVLQVSVKNTPALALYRALGFTEHHRYRYWRPPVAACEDREL